MRSPRPYVDPVVDRVTTVVARPLAVPPRTYIAAIGLYLVGLVARRGLAQGQFHFNDTGYHLRISQLLVRYYPHHIVYDPNWRGGIVMNYPSLFETIPAYLYILTDVPLRTLYPVVTMVVWATVPVAVFALLRYYTNWYGATFGGALAVYPLVPPDQVHVILALTVSLFTSGVYLTYLRKRTVPWAVVFGLSVGLLFWTHFFLFSFFVFVWTIFGLCYLVVPPHLVSDGEAAPGTDSDTEAANDSRDDEDGGPSSRWDLPDRPVDVLQGLIVTLPVALAVFFTLTAEWWYFSLITYGSDVFDSPLSDLSGQGMVAATAAPVGPLTLRFGLFIVLPAVLGMFGIVFLVVTDHGTGDIPVDRNRFVLLAGYASVVVVLGMVFFYGYTVGITYGPVWRYYIFVVLGAILLSGMLAGVLAALIETWGLPEDGRTVLRVLGVGTLVVIAAVGGIAGHTAAQNHTTTTHITWPRDAIDQEMATYGWVNRNIGPRQTVATGPVHSSYLLAFSKVTTVTGHYGHTSPNPIRDRDAAIMLYSSNYTATSAALERYDVEYLLVERGGMNGLFEAGVRWADLWKGPDDGQPLQFDKFDYFGEAVYERGPLVVYRVNRSRPPTGEGVTVPVDRAGKWEFTKLIKFENYRAEHEIDDGLSLRFRPSSETEYYAQRPTNVSVGGRGAFVEVTANVSGEAYPHLALHYTNGSSVEASRWVDQYWRHARTYYGNGTVTYQVYFPSVGGRIDRVKIGVISRGSKRSWRAMTVENIRIYQGEG